MSALKKEKNYLDRIPVKNPDFVWKEDDKGNITVEMPHRGVFDRIAQKVFFTPPVSHIKLDRFGSFVWKHIDGTRNLAEIGALVGREFGEKAEPLYERLAKYFEILHNNRFIRWRKQKTR